MRERIQIGQRWRERASGIQWRVAQIHRPDGSARLEAEGYSARYVSFSALGRYCEPLGREAQR